MFVAAGAVGREAVVRRPARRRPIAVHSRTNTLSALAATTTSAPSLVGYTFDGATPGSTLPVRDRVTPASS